MRAVSEWRHGTVVPSNHNGEWTFTYFLNGVEVRHEDWSGKTFSRATAAKQAMRDFIEEMRLDLPRRQAAKGDRIGK